MLSSSALVYSKVLSSIGVRLTGYKCSMRIKYIKKDATKEQLYALPFPKSINDNEIVRLTEVGDPMRFGFVDFFFPNS